MVNFIESKTAPNPTQYKYWVDLTENHYGGSIKYFNGSSWIKISDESSDLTAIKNSLNNKVDKVSGKQLSTEDFTTALKNKLNDIEEGATRTIVDSQMSASSTNPVQNKVVQAAINAVSSKVDNIIEDAPEAYDTLKEISDYISTHETEYDALLAISNNKVDKIEGKGLSENDYTDGEKTKLAGIANNANNYSHPTSAGNKHIPTGGSANQILTWKANGEAQWSNAPSTTVDKATADALGGIKVGYTTSGKNYAVQLDNNDKAFVNVNWSDTKVAVNNTLTSDSTAEALSAAQGKQLKALIDTLTARVEALETPAA